MGVDCRSCKYCKLIGGTRPFVYICQRLFIRDSLKRLNKIKRDNKSKCWVVRDGHYQ